jgi:phosphoheptose isomerase
LRAVDLADIDHLDEQMSCLSRVRQLTEMDSLQLDDEADRQLLSLLDGEEVVVYGNYGRTRDMRHFARALHAKLEALRNA